MFWKSGADGGLPVDSSITVPTGTPHPCYDKHN
jgi:hypothetical protein